MAVDTGMDDGAVPLEPVLCRMAERVYGRDTQIENLRRLSGGASRETWSFDVLLPEGERVPLILKRDPAYRNADGTITGEQAPLGVSRITEGRLIELAGGAGVPVPDVVAYLEADECTTEGFVTRRLEGEALGLRIARDEGLAEARENLAFQCGHAAARLHGIAVDSLPPLESMNVREELAYNRELMDASQHPYPGFEYGFSWLEERVELAGERHTLVHGDFRNGNLLVSPGGLRAVLDWELGHLGNPVMDLGWLCIPSWRYGHVDKPVGGFGETSEMLAGYEAGGGERVSEQSLHFWEVFGTLHWGILCIEMAFRHLNGPNSSLEQAVIGRRTAETEYDLLQLVD